MTKPLLVTFMAGDRGPWSITSNRVVLGQGLPQAPALAVHEGVDRPAPQAGSGWSLRGVVSNERYVNRAERIALKARQEGLGRPEPTIAVLFPIRKSPDW